MIPELHVKFTLPSYYQSKICEKLAISSGRARGGVDRCAQMCSVGHRTEIPVNTGHDQGSFLDRLAKRGKEKPARLSTILQLMAESSEDRIPIGRLVEAFSDRAFGALMFIFALPNVIPMPPGTSAVLGAPLVVIAAQLMIGRSTLWLPKALLRRSVRTVDLQRMNSAVGRYLRKTERFLSPRLSYLFGPIGDRAIGAVCLLLSIILFLPIPFGNMLPALAIACFALALLERDGILAILGLVVAVAAVGMLVAISGALWIGVKAFFHALPPIFG